MLEPENSDILFFRDNLELIKTELNNIRKYLKGCKLPDISSDTFDNASRRKASLIDSLIKWQEKYNKMSGILSYYNHMLEQEKKEKSKKQLRKGVIDSGITDRIRARNKK